MKNQRKSLLWTTHFALLVITAVAVLATASALFGAQAKVREGEDFPHMDAALGYLKAARAQLEQAEPEFHGHREKAIQHVEAATTDVQKGVDNYLAAHPNPTRNEIPVEQPPAEGKKFPHMEGALSLLQQAAMHLSKATPQYNGKRVEGLAETRAAIGEIQTGLKMAHK